MVSLVAQIMRWLRSRDHEKAVRTSWVMHIVRFEDGHGGATETDLHWDDAPLILSRSVLASYQRPVSGETSVIHLTHLLSKQFLLLSLLVESFGFVCCTCGVRSPGTCLCPPLAFNIHTSKRSRFRQQSRARSILVHGPFSGVSSSVHTVAPSRHKDIDYMSPSRGLKKVQQIAQSSEEFYSPYLTQQKQ